MVGNVLHILIYFFFRFFVVVVFFNKHFCNKYFFIFVFVFLIKDFVFNWANLLNEYKLAATFKLN